MPERPEGDAASVVQQIEDSIALKRQLITRKEVILEIAAQMIQVFRQGKKVLFFGNGGSAADAQHLAGELAGKLYLRRDSLPAIALTTNTSSLTAIANDFDFGEVFSRQLRGLAVRGDMAVGISTSGDSANVIAGIEEAKRCGAITVAFIGQGGKLGEIADYVLSVPSTDTPRIQETHITAGHIVCCLVEKALFGEDRSAGEPGSTGR